MILGRIDEVDGHSVATHFLAGLVPRGTVYVARPGTRSKLPGGGAGIPIPRDPRSVLVAYGRVWLPIAALAMLAAFGARGHVPLALWPFVLGLALLSAAAWRAGQLPPDELARLRLLGTVTGLKIAPDRLTPQMREAKRDSLGDLMEKGGIPVSCEGILSVLDDIPHPALPLVYGYCRYAGDDAEWQACAAEVYQRHLEAELG